MPTGCCGGQGDDSDDDGSDGYVFGGDANHNYISNRNTVENGVATPRSSIKEPARQGSTRPAPEPPMRRPTANHEDFNDQPAAPGRTSVAPQQPFSMTDIKQRFGGPGHGNQARGSRNYENVPQGNVPPPQYTGNVRFADAPVATGAVMAPSIPAAPIAPAYSSAPNPARPNRSYSVPVISKSGFTPAPLVSPPAPVAPAYPSVPAASPPPARPNPAYSAAPVAAPAAPVAPAYSSAPAPPAYSAPASFSVPINTGTASTPLVHIPASAPVAPAYSSVPPPQAAAPSASYSVPVLNNNTLTSGSVGAQVPPPPPPPPMSGLPAAPPPSVPAPPPTVQFQPVFAPPINPAPALGPYTETIPIQYATGTVGNQFREPSYGQAVIYEATPSGPISSGPLSSGPQLGGPGSDAQGWTLVSKIRVE